STSTSFNLAVIPVNDPPIISTIGAQAINEDTTSSPIAFSVGDPETPPSALTVSATSSNPILVPNANLQLGGSGGSRTLTIIPAPNQNGSATITVKVR